MRKLCGFKIKIDDSEVTFSLNHEQSRIVSCIACLYAISWGVKRFFFNYIPDLMKPLTSAAHFIRHERENIKYFIKFLHKNRLNSIMLNAIVHDDDTVKQAQKRLRLSLSHIKGFFSTMRFTKIEFRAFLCARLHLILAETYANLCFK